MSTATRFPPWDLANQLDWPGFISVDTQEAKDGWYLGRRRKKAGPMAESLEWLVFWPKTEDRRLLTIG
jgi:hypothetical protein